MFEETCTPLNPLYYGKGPAGAVANSDGRRRFVEMGIPVKAELYIVGQSRERQDIVAPEIAADEHAPMFLISTRSEEQVSSGMKWGARCWTIFGLLSVDGFTVWRDGALNVDPRSRIAIYVAIAAGYLFLGLLAWIWMVFNSLVDVRQRVHAAWALVDIQLKRRFDLIPNLVNCVKGYSDHEAQLQTELAALRNQLVATPPGVAGPDHGAVSNVIVGIAERYPELKASESFLALQKNLSDTEQRIALASDVYLFDTPGMLWPRIVVEQSGYHLAASGGIGRNAYDEEDVAMALLARIRSRYADRLQTRYKITNLADIPDEALLSEVGRKRGGLLAGGQVNLQKAAEIALNDFRSGAWGRITLETPEEWAVWLATAEAREAERLAKANAKQRKGRNKPSAGPYEPPPES